jgi:hypothetical protein
MRCILAFLSFTVIVALTSSAFAQAHKVVYAKDGSGVFGNKDTPIQPWSGYHVHDPDRPAPKKVDPGAPASDRPNQPPSDAIVLFDGKDLSAWQATQWKVEEGCLVATQGPMATKQEFGSCQLHVEWLVPLEQPESVWNHGNNGVFLGGSIEVQIFDSYRTKIYPDGQAAAIYAQTPPLVNACRKPGQWEVYDIVYRAPKFGKDRKLESPARITMFHNGVLVHWDQEVYGGSPHAGVASYDSVKARAPIAFGAHGCPVRFRNLWIRPLDAEPQSKAP